MYYYNVYGLALASEIAIPEFKGAICEAHDNVDVTIRSDAVPEHLDSPSRKGVCYELARQTLLLNIRDIARYGAVNGAEIFVDRHPEADERDVVCFLVDAPLTAIIQQRGMLPFYGGAVQVDGGCVMICGPSGFGKSAIIDGLVRRGHVFLTDDLCVVCSVDGALAVQPGAPCQKLKPHTLMLSQRKPEDYPRIREHIHKYVVPIDEDQRTAAVLPLKKIIFVGSHNLNATEFACIENENNKFNLVHDAMHRQYLVGMGTGFSQMKLTAQIMEQVPAYLLKRQQKADQMAATLDLLEKEALS